MHKPSTRTIVLLPIFVFASTCAASKNLRGAATTNQHQKQAQQQLAGAQWLKEVETDIYRRIEPVVGQIVDHLQRKTPVILMGSWPSKQIVDARRRSGYASPDLVANDLDVFFSVDDDNGEEESLEVIFSSIKYFNMILPGSQVSETEEIIINTVGTKGLSSERLLQNNDVDVTGVAIEASRDENTGELQMKVHVSPAFWKFLFPSDGKFIIRPANSSVVHPIQTLVRIAYKAFQMKIDYDAKDIHPVQGEIVSASHMKKINAIKEWENNPFEKIVIGKNEGGSTWDAYKVTAVKE